MPEDTDPSLPRGGRFERWAANHQRGLLMGLFAMVVLAAFLWGQATPSISGREGSQDVKRDVVSLREYIDIRLNALEAKIDASNQMRQLAIDKAEASVNDRLQGMNEFRDQLKDQGQTFATKNEADARAALVDQRLNSIDNQFSTLNGTLKAGGFIVLLLNIGLGIFSAWMGFRRSRPRNGDRGAP